MTRLPRLRSWPNWRILICAARRRHRYKFGTHPRLGVCIECDWRPRQ